MADKWMADAVPKSHTGKFAAKAKAAGESTSAYAHEKAHAAGTLGKEARLALVFAHHRPGNDAAHHLPSNPTAY